MQHSAVRPKACAVQYLKQKGILNESIQSSVPPSQRCRLLVPFAQHVVRFIQKDSAIKYFSNEAECMMDEYDKREVFDYVTVFSVKRYSSLFTDKEEIKESEDQRQDVWKSIRIQCGVVCRNNAPTNNTIELHQYEYCNVKYAIDNQLLPEFKNAEISPNHTDLGSVDCTNIIDAERKEAENDYNNRMSAIETDQESLDCAMNEFRQCMYDWRAALKALTFIDSDFENLATKDAATSRLYKNIEDYLSNSTSVCNKN